MKLEQLAQTFGLREYMFPVWDIGSPQQIQTLGLNLTESVKLKRYLFKTKNS